MVKELSSTPIPPKIIVNLLHPLNDKNKPVTLIATDGSLKGRHGRKVAAAVIAFGHGSPLNTFRIVFNSSSTLYAEINGTLLALQTALSEKLSNCN